MNKFICFIRGGTSNPEELELDKERWKIWIENLIENNHVIDNGVLTIDGKIVEDNGTTVKTFHFNLGENASGYIILQANELEEAVSLTKDCPVFAYGGNITIRPIVEKYSSK